jgi:hypothetical protein
MAGLKKVFIHINSFRKGITAMRVRYLSIYVYIAALSFASSAALAQTARDDLDKAQQAVGTQAFTATDYKPGTVQHIVLFRFKDSTTPAQIEAVNERFLSLKEAATRDGKPYIVRLDSGRQNSGEGADRGYQQAFIVTFRSEGDRNYYVGTPVVSNPEFSDPAHARFKEFVGPLLAETNGVLVYDFMVK